MQDPEKIKRLTKHYGWHDWENSPEGYAERLYDAMLVLEQMAEDYKNGNKGGTKPTYSSSTVSFGQEVNIVIRNEYFEELKHWISYLFGDWNGENIPHIEYLDPPIDMYDILVKYEFFKSKGDAKRNWKKTGQQIPCGFICLSGIGKLKRSLYIWNPPYFNIQILTQEQFDNRHIEVQVTADYIFDCRDWEPLKDNN